LLRKTSIHHPPRLRIRFLLAPAPSLYILASSPHFPSPPLRHHLSSLASVLLRTVPRHRLYIHSVHAHSFSFLFSRSIVFACILRQRERFPTAHVVCCRRRVSYVLLYRTYRALSIRWYFLITQSSAQTLKSTPQLTPSPTGASTIVTPRREYLCMRSTRLVMIGYRRWKCSPTTSPNGVVLPSSTNGPRPMPAHDVVAQVEFERHILKPGLIFVGTGLKPVAFKLWSTRV
jgi:hypothetical protein